MMKRIFLISVAFLAALVPSFAQDVQQAAAEAAEAITTAPAAEAKIVKPKYWDNSLKTQINVGQTSLTNWAAGGDNTVSLQGFIDANANYKKNELFWNNRLQLDYGFLYASSKPILQKNADRIYLESKFGYKTEKMKNLYFSANYDFKSQFSNGYEYKTPGVDNIEEMARKDQIQAWKDARVLKSGFLAPAYTNLALGIDYTPTKWLTVNFAPVTGGFVIVRDTLLRQSYSMAPKKGVTEVKGGADLRNYRFELGAQLKLDVKVNVNDNFSYSSQVVLFSNYLDHPENLRVNWDNRFDWKIAKYFSFTLTTNLIYDDKIMIKSDKDIDKFPDGRQRVQFKETLAFGFTYTIVSKKN